MKKYEAMLIIKPNLSHEEMDSVLSQIKDTISTVGGSIVSAEVWAERKNLAYSIRKFKEALYYLVQFRIEPKSISKLIQVYKLNDSILRTLITKL